MAVGFPHSHKAIRQWLIFPKFANSNKGKKGALHIRMHPLKHYFFDLNICFFTHVQRFAVCPIQKKMNKKPILPCTAPMGECAVNTIIRTKVTTLMASRMANIVHNHFVCLFKPFTFVSQFLLPKCKYRCSITKMNINIPRMQCKYIHVANGNQTNLYLHTLPFVYLTAIPTRQLA